MIRFDGDLDLAIGMGAKSKIWKNQKMSWSNLINRLKDNQKTHETFKEFISASREDQSRIKDVGGYVGGYLRGGRRHPKNVVHRQLLTLDIDFAHRDFWEDFCLQFNNAAVVHGTHKHCETSPRFRLIMPLSRECTPDEYVATARKIAGTLGIDLFDKSTFETNRLMFWPSTPKDVEYYFEFQDGPWVDVDEILNSYLDWTDSSLWPTANREISEVKNAAKKQEDPENKKGIIGAFCRTYSITEVIENFLGEVYVTTDITDRFTYLKGTTAAGLIVYDDKFAYSHHGTDPCGGKLCNAFDLVRIHKFGHLDDEEAIPGSKPKSFSAMEEFARSDKQVRKLIATENIQEAKYDFIDDEDPQEVGEDAIEWMKELEVDSKNNYLSTSTNLNMIFTNDHRLKNLFRQNDFDSKRYVFGNLPWRKVLSPEPVKNVDYSGVRNYLECIYGITGAMKIEDAMALEFERNHFHPIVDYLKGLRWDEIKRIDNLLIDLFGASENIYTKEAIRKMLVGAVARVFDPGVKFELVLTLVSGMQGTGKSSFFKALGRSWFSDTFGTVQGKEAFEQLQGAWVIEMAELAGLKKAEIETVKHFIAKQEDSFRFAYAKTIETYKRQCVFVATTNESAFLRDPSGNRRFMPIDIQNKKVGDNKKLMDFLNNDSLIDQIWAEAVYLYRKGEPLFLSKEAEKIASVQQKLHSEVDERKGIIEAYLNTPLPDKWESMDIFERRSFLNDPLSPKGTIDRVYICIAEIWCECLGKNKEDMDRYKTREINDILRGLDDWEQVNSTRNFPIYGKQKYYARRID